MSSFSLGPLALSVQAFMVVLGVVVAWVVAAILGRQRQVPAGDALFNLVIVALLGARLVFVLRYWPYYADAPLSTFNIRDGGFDPWGALLAGGAWLVWRLRPEAKKALRVPLLAAVFSGLGIWGMATTMLVMAEQTAREMPDVWLNTPQSDELQSDTMLQVLSDNVFGENLPTHSLKEVSLSDATRGKGAVVNIWATWCPPCRREMPVLAQAQKEHRDLRMIFVNQGETEHQVNHFLQQQGLTLDFVYFDPLGKLSAAVSAHGLPTTLFYNAEGKLVDVRMGELSKATLQKSIDLIHTSQY